jgi:DNA polymerase
MSELTDLAAQIRTCTRCPLHQSRTNAVPGEGPEHAEIMFIGEAPGFYEDQQGRPFVGQAGKYLEELLGKITLRRDQVAIYNVIKCRPPQNRDPLPEELEACRVYLDQQIALIRPKVIVTISRFAMARFFPDKKISQIHGSAKRFDEYVIVPMYHPAAALHQPSLKPVLEADFKKLPGYIRDLARIEPAAEEEKKEEPKQLSLF